MKKPAPTPPASLSDQAAKWWAALIDDYSITDPAGLLLLEQALRSYDRAEEARRLIDQEGAVVADRFGQKRQHPAAQIERDHRAALVRTLAALGIDGAP